MERRVFFAISLILVGLLLIILFVSMQTIFFASTQKINAATITVDDSGGADYAKIQDAINASSPGDTIYVYNGIYNENLTINKTINLTGESNQNTIIKGNGISNSKGVSVTANYVNISNIMIDNFFHNLYISGSNSTISNTITNCSLSGIFLYSGSNNNIASNTITNCGWSGILLFSSSNNNVTSNTITNSSEYGIYLYESSNNNIASNTITNCSWNGILLYYSSNNNNVTSNTITNRSEYGIYIYYLDPNNNTITSNTITNNIVGIYLSSTSNNTITSNNIYGNEQYGLYLRLSEYPSIGNTAINNWWGDSTGPYCWHNPIGKGDNVSGDIPIRPWATSPFNISTPPTPTINPPLTTNEAKKSTISIPGFEIIASLCAVSLLVVLNHRRKR